MTEEVKTTDTKVKAQKSAQVKKTVAEKEVIKPEAKMDFVFDPEKGYVLKEVK